MADRIFHDDDDTVTEKEILLEIYRMLRTIKLAAQVWLVLVAFGVVAWLLVAALSSS